MGLEDGSEEGNAVSATNRRCRNKKQAGKDAAVQGTNDSSIVSKCSMVNLGYFCDGFLKGFVNKTIRRVPLINRGYYVRAKAVDYCLHGFLQHTESYPQRQIISLGAGFDSLYFRLKANGELKNVIMYEVDFPDVVQRKATLIKNKQELVELIGCTYEMGPTQMGHLCGMDYKLLGIDLSEIMELDNALMEIGLNTACPTLLLSEVVLTYMKNESSSAVIRWAADRFSSAVFVVYEQIRPNDPFGQVMQQHFAQLNSTLHALVRFPGKEAQQKRFLQEGWEECLCVDMNEFYVRYIPEQEKQRIEMLEPFDEYEEWHLKCSHYIILCASKGDLIKYLPFTPSPDFYINKLGTCIRDPLQLSVSLCETETQNPLLRRFAHCSALVAPHTVVTTGGFGNRVGQHGRLRDISLLAKSGSVWKSSSIRDDDNLLTERMFHSMTALCDSRCLIIGGRTSPLNPITSILCLKCDTGGGGITNARLSLKAIECSGTMPSPRWRHTATEVIYRDQKYLFIYGGRSPNELVLGDWHFLSLQDYSWTDIPVDGPSPESRHSHCACTWKGGALITGGLGIAQVPLGSIFHLRPTLYGFVWERIEMISSVIPRYSHTAHVLDDKLILLGGVLIHSDPIPEVTLIDLKTGQNFDCYIDTNPVKWPLMLHNHSSVLLAKERQLLVIGGGGNCFSFGTHLNHQPVLIQLPEIR